MKEPLVELRDITTGFQKKIVLESVSLTLNQDEIVTLIGPNGAGKSTLIRVVLGLVQADKGMRSVKAGLRVGYMPQKLHVTPTMPLTVGRFLTLSGASRKNIVWALSCTETTHLRESPVQHLSGGEMQRVLLSRALLRDPHLLVLDEPVQGVDVNGQYELYQLITQLRDRLGCGVLLVSHDLHLVMAATDRVICLNRHICCSGHPHQVKQHSAYLRLFGRYSGELAVYSHHHDHRHTDDGRLVKENSRSTGDCTGATSVKEREYDK